MLRKHHQCLTFSRVQNRWCSSVCEDVTVNGPYHCRHSVSCRNQRQHWRRLETHSASSLKMGARHCARCIPDEHPTKSPRLNYTLATNHTIASCPCNPPHLLQCQTSRSQKQHHILLPHPSSSSRSRPLSSQYPKARKARRNRSPTDWGSSASS